MGSKAKIFLLIDAIVNLILGLLLLLFPLGMAEWLGLPGTDTYFYPTLLGAVLLGIGFALIIERVGFERKIRGLSLGGAIVINIVGASVLMIWLLFGSLVIPTKGRIILWAVAVLVLLIGVCELFSQPWRFQASKHDP